MQDSGNWQTPIETELLDGKVRLKLSYQIDLSTSSAKVIGEQIIGHTRNMG